MASKNISSANYVKKCSALVLCISLVAAMTACNKTKVNPDDPKAVVLAAYDSTSKRIEEDFQKLASKSPALKAISDIQMGNNSTNIEYKLTKAAANDMDIKLNEDLTVYIDITHDGILKNTVGALKAGIKNTATDIWANIFLNKNKDIGFAASFLNKIYGYNLLTAYDDFKNSSIKEMLTAGATPEDIKHIEDMFKSQGLIFSSPTDPDEARKILSNVDFKYSKDESITVGENAENINTKLYVGTINKENAPEFINQFEGIYNAEYTQMALKDISIAFNIADNRIYAVSISLNMQDDKNIGYDIKLGSKDNLIDYLEYGMTIEYDTQPITISSVLKQDKADKGIAYVWNFKAPGQISEENIGFRITPAEGGKELLNISLSSPSGAIGVNGTLTTEKDSVLFVLNKLDVPETDTSFINDLFTVKFSKLASLDDKIPTKNITNIFKVDQKELLNDMQSATLALVLEMSKITTIPMQ